jgi:hypothetical protein
LIDCVGRGRSLNKRKGPTGMAGKTPDIDRAVVEARLAEVIARFGDDLTTDQRDEVRKRIERTLQLGSAMRSTTFGNADEPEIGFAPYRGDL